MNPRTLAVGWGLIVTAVLIVIPLSVRDRLPEPLATHWSDGPDSASSFTRFLIISVLTWAVPWAIVTGIAVQGRMFQRRLSRMYWWGFLFGGAVFVTGMELSTLYANLDRQSWHQAVLPGWVVIAVVTAAVGIGILAGYAGRGEPDQLSPAGEGVPRLRLRPGQRSVWVSRVVNPWLMAMAAAAGAALVVTGGLTLLGVLSREDLGRLLPGMAIVLVAGLATSSATVRVTQDGLAIGFGPFGWPVRRIRLSKIDRAWSEVRYPSQVGGWGLRGLPGMAAIMLRGGDCLILRYRSGGQLLISVDDAERGASLVNALIEERA
ncbi:hypothetical protein [Nonomuraea sediminis]|uniref:hypothetical protein n=1 Tax=Nonomuraea sediminis TaxID=2835864 RepID=UPI001BDC30A4|nr:hypothetical protein [Nonomuraea sediminis]